MTHVMCNPWKTTFTLAPLALLTVISPMCDNIESIENCLFFVFWFIWLLNICHIFPMPWKFGLMTFKTKYVFLFEKLIWFSWFGKISIHNVSLFSTANLLIFNFISSQSRFAMFVMIILNVFMNLFWKDIVFVL